MKGYRLRIVSSDAFATEKLLTMEARGDEVTVVPSGDGRVSRDPVLRVIAQAQEYAAEPDTYWTMQLHNRGSWSATGAMVPVIRNLPWQ